MSGRSIVEDDWSDLERIRERPHIDFDALNRYRLERLRGQLIEQQAAMCLLVSPISLRYAVNYRSYALFQSHIPLTYLFVPREGPVVIYGGYGNLPNIDEARPAQPICYFDGGPYLVDAAKRLAQDIVAYLDEIGSDLRRVAVEYVNPSVTQALERKGLEVIDGVGISEAARLIKSAEEIECMKWAIAVAEHGIAKLTESLSPGVSELQLWGLLNYANLANNGDWHDGRMLASGPRINPWLQEASPRRVESGDLVGLDTDMVGPFGYFADISRTFHCGPASPTRRQKELYRLAVAEIEHNLSLVRNGVTFREFQAKSFEVPEAFHENAYPCILHGVGMCDEYPYLKPRFRETVSHDGALETGMVVCIESYMGAVGERDGVKLEQQVRVTDDGYELLTGYPLEDCLL